MEIAWAAGFYDGEGTTCCVSGDYDRKSLHLTIGQVNRDNLMRFQKAVGGLGRIHNPMKREGRKPFSKFAAYGAEAHLIIQRLWPYLGAEKRAQSISALVEYSFRSVWNLPIVGRCRRNHILLEVGTYTDPKGRKECAKCRSERRHGKLAKTKISALDLRIGIREYTPKPILLISAEQYRSSIET